MSLLSTTTTPTDAELEFDRQVDCLALAGLPALLDVKDECFRAMLEPLRDLLPSRRSRGGGVPFVVVVPDAPVGVLLGAVSTPGGCGGSPLSAGELAGFAARPELDVPSVPYLLLDVELGEATAGLPATEAEARVVAAGRTPLTLAEGVAVLLCDCGVRRATPSFTLLGSRNEAGAHPVLVCGADGPVLTGAEAGTARDDLGAASCGGRRAR